MNNEPTLFDKTPLVYKDEHFTEEQKASTKANANKQEAQILKLLRSFPTGCGATWIQCHLQFRECQDFLITSIRRALTNLAKQGKVEKMEETEPSRHGKNEHLWRLKR